MHHSFIILGHRLWDSFLNPKTGYKVIKPVTDEIDQRTSENAGVFLRVGLKMAGVSEHFLVDSGPDFFPRWHTCSFSCRKLNKGLGSVITIITVVPTGE